MRSVGIEEIEKKNAISIIRIKLIHITLDFRLYLDIITIITIITIIITIITIITAITTIIIHFSLFYYITIGEVLRDKFKTLYITKYHSFIMIIFQIKIRFN
ncbi:hypothetical protein DU86_12295 [Methanosarcina mazei]|jgi:hypothetical protein|uniref:Uncharacterized protein n=1 Tax=Methanosarcina mazei TaxID=2209 RepID=A0A0F8DU67_METMZ|nr:hypothetical protein DU31_11910 [Methanosarcina mazei]KKG01019.1 hypothetical protein DU47_16700 [Methanosarcina mazei]KKG03543.1 hypothetical protein DU40_10895 [Methanosarcina mazei]KKG19212.1 hypothetical protein DU34_11650 [Methanosarcina mazei]KKG31151.1 hypothetical protein DU49_20035 [Methanosarcina mazei]